MSFLEKMEKYSKFGSWAVWESTNPNGLFEKEQDMNENIDFIQYANELQPSNYVILAMNPGGTFNEHNAKKATKKAKVSGRRWSNFHNIGRSRDYLLAKAIMSTRCYGTYMTDLFPVVGSASKDVEKFINNKNNINVVNRFIKEFDEEMSCLLPNESEIILICIGKYVYKYAKKYLINNSNLEKKYKPYQFPHYSSQNGGQVSSSINSPKYYPAVFRDKIKEYHLDL
ncbi:hypothetical protein [Filifactor alocis]|uniref:hypothetical protein n=1 Tax=Filifactor alocis TaxID=143361 RepID=UPI003C6F558B